MHDNFLPSCYPDHKIWQEWLYWAKVSKEIANPCMDCSIAYEAQMMSLLRCNKETTSKIWVNKKWKSLMDTNPCCKDSSQERGLATHSATWTLWTHSYQFITLDTWTRCKGLVWWLRSTKSGTWRKVAERLCITQKRRSKPHHGWVLGFIRARN